MIDPDAEVQAAISDMFAAALPGRAELEKLAKTYPPSGTPAPPAPRTASVCCAP